MLTIEVPIVEGFDNATQKFVIVETFKLELEHSLVSLSKWEMFFEKPFLSDVPKTPEETLYYIQCMVLNEEVPAEVWTKLTNENLEAINNYINAKQTATTINEGPGKPGQREVVTNEVMYYWMCALQIDWQAQYWHLNRLITLVKVLNIKNSPPQKMSRRDAMARQRELNAQRRAQHGTTG